MPLTPPRSRAILGRCEHNAPQAIRPAADILLGLTMDIIIFLLIGLVAGWLAGQIVKGGGRWLDVRLPSEFQNLAIEGALNVPLYLIRLKLTTLDRKTPFVVYCDTGRRSSAAAYILVERGFDAYVLRGGVSNGGLQLARGAGEKP